jgi:hypothetical protein
MSTSITHETVTTEFAEAGGVRYAYRRFGGLSDTPLVFVIASAVRWTTGTRR